MMTTTEAPTATPIIDDEKKKALSVAQAELSELRRRVEDLEHAEATAALRRWQAKIGAHFTVRPADMDAKETPYVLEIMGPANGSTVMTVDPATGDYPVLRMSADGCSAWDHATYSQNPARTNPQTWAAAQYEHLVPDAEDVHTLAMGGVQFNITRHVDEAMFNEIRDLSSRGHHLGSDVQWEFGRAANRLNSRNYGVCDFMNTTKCSKRCHAEKHPACRGPSIVKKGGPFVDLEEKCERLLKMARRLNTMVTM
jgi:hypothetical protein